MSLRPVLNVLVHLKRLLALHEAIREILRCGHPENLARDLVRLLAVVRGAKA